MVLSLHCHVGSIPLARHLHCEICNLKLFCHLQAISSLVEGDGSIVQINDKKLASTLRIKLRFSDTVMHDANGTG